MVKIAALVLLQRFFDGNERCLARLPLAHSKAVLYALYSYQNNIKYMISDDLEIIYIHRMSNAIHTTGSFIQIQRFAGNTCLYIQRSFLFSIHVLSTNSVIAQYKSSAYIEDNYNRVGSKGRYDNVINL